MKITNKAKTTYIFKLELNEEEAKQLVNEIADIKIGEPKINNHIFAKVFMVLSDALQDLGLREMVEGRSKGDRSYPRLDNDEVEVDALNAKSEIGDKK